MKNEGRDQTTGVIWQQILLFFFPILLGTFFQQLYNTADAVIVGNFVGKEALSAVGGTTGTLINLLVGFFVLHIKYAILWAILVALLDFLPFFGTGTVLIPWAVLKVLSGSYKFAVGLIIIYLVSQLVRQVIQPKIVGDTIGLNPLSTMVFMYIGYKVGGIIAMIIAVPIGLIVVNLYEAGAFDDIIKDVKELAEGLNEYRKGE